MDNPSMNKYNNYDNYDNYETDDYYDNYETEDYYDNSYNNSEEKHDGVINGLFGFLCFGLIATHCLVTFCKIFDNRYNNRYQQLEDLRIREENNRLNLIIQEKKKNIKKETKIQKYDSSLLILDNSCSICLDNFEEGENIHTLKCNHSFHDKCIEDWLDTQFTCPLCRLSL